MNWPASALVIGYGLSGRAAAAWLAGQGCQVTVLEDNPAGAPVEDSMAVEVTPEATRAASLARSARLVVPSPGVPVTHPAVVAARQSGVPVAGEVELAWRLMQQKRDLANGPATGRLVAITGTNGKTTVTELVTAMLVASGVPASAVGNVGVPLIEAAQRWRPERGEVLVAEVSSFQLEYTVDFAPDVSCWLNFAPDHLDWHPSLDHYRQAKARIWANQGPGSTVVINADDGVVMASARGVPPGVDVVEFGSGRQGDDVDWHVGADRVEGPDGFVLEAAELPRAFPHDLANVAAAAAVALAAGADVAGCREAARSMPLPPHRAQLVGEAGGTSWYDDSKATTPAAVMAVLAGLSSVVLVAGGRNKGLDLSVLARAVPPVRAVVAIGEAAPEISEAFSSLVPTRSASSMAEAVDLAAELARPGDAVVLSPGCASFDWYSSYGQRGDHFSALVKQKIGGKQGVGTTDQVNPTQEGKAAAK